MRLAAAAAAAAATGGGGAVPSRTEQRRRKGKGASTGSPAASRFEGSFARKMEMHRQRTRRGSLRGEEAQSAAAVSHDHVVTIYAVGVNEQSKDSPRVGRGGLPYLVMEFIDGPSLQQKLIAATASKFEEWRKKGKRRKRR